MKVLAYKSKLNVTNLPQQYGLPYKISMKSVGVGNVTTYDRNTLSTSTFRFSCKEIQLIYYLEVSSYQQDYLDSYQWLLTL